MKSEERRHLAENDLEQTLTRWVDRVEPYSARLMGATVLITAITVGGILWYRLAHASSDAGWAELASARTPENLLDVAKEYPDTRAAQWAELRAARLLYDRGVAESLTNRAASDDDFSDARSLFGKLVKADLPPELREAALDGLARTLEATSSGDTSPAIEAYETLVHEFPESIFRSYAAHRIEVLKQPDTQQFYAWFSKQDPKPPERPQPNDGKAGSGPLTTPELPSLDFPSSDGEQSPEGDAAPGLPAINPFSAPPAEGDSIVPPLSGTASPDSAPTVPALPKSTIPETPAPGSPATEPAPSETPAEKPAPAGDPAPPAENPTDAAPVQPETSP